MVGRELQWRRIPICVVPGGSLTAKRYIGETLQDHVLPHAPFIGKNFPFLHDNARSDVAGINSPRISSRG